ncbi:MAG: lactoylglutathione lyase [Rickettsiales bacterium]|jgi:lactoylglutathione lyase
MARIRNIEESLDFYCNKLGLIETKRYESQKGKFTLIFLAAPDDLENAKINQSPLIELTYNWPDQNGETEQYQSGRNFGHLAFRVDDIYDFCQKLIDKGLIINRPPRDGHMSFVKSPDNISVELLQKGDSLEICEPWKSMENIGSW